MVATEGGKISYWITRKQVSYDNTDYYAETILHDGLYNPDPFLFWTGVYDNLDVDMQELEKILAHLDNMIGFDDRKTLMNSLNMAPTRHQRYIL